MVPSLPAVSRPWSTTSALLAFEANISSCSSKSSSPSVARRGSALSRVIPFGGSAEISSRRTFPPALLKNVLDMLGDDAAAEAHFALVQHHRLPRRDGPLRHIELNPDLALQDASEPARRVRLAVARLGRKAVVTRRLTGHPGRVLRRQLLPEKQRVIVALHYDELVRPEPLLGDIPSFAVHLRHAADADALPLSDGVEGEADVLADHAPLRSLDRARRLRQVAVQEFAEGPLADEADAGRVLFGVVWQPRFERQAPHLGLLQLAEREHHARELLLVQAMQEVALVLC